MRKDTPIATVCFRETSISVKIHEEKALIYIDRNSDEDDIRFLFESRITSRARIYFDKDISDIEILEETRGFLLSDYIWIKFSDDDITWNALLEHVDSLMSR